MENKLPLEECSIQQIYMDSKEPMIYKIPVYQRNYAWEEDEVTALVKDIYDSFHKNATAPYYIGTLVTYKRGDNAYEVIDGQQRLTTIYLLLKALGFEQIKNRLTYSARKISAATLERLPDFGDEFDQGIRNGFTAAQNALEMVEEQEREAFIKYFLQQVHIIHYCVPKDVDLNHYFEVMNSRGEQLEKHEIVKSLLSQLFKDKRDIATFSQVWEACSDMGIYIQQALPETDVFGNRLQDFDIDYFEDIPRRDEMEGKKTILDLIGDKVEMIEEEESGVQNDRFQPIIDFPNFLLIVLKLTLFYDYQDVAPQDIILDDKELLSEFQKTIRGLDDEHAADNFVKNFAYNLLRAKYYLDNYMVHHVLNSKEIEHDNPWKLQYFYRQNKNQRYPLNLFGDTDTHKELVQLLSMFEVSFSAKQRKNYLFYCLAFLFEEDEEDYLEFVEELADKYFCDVYLNRDRLNERNQPLPNAFDDAILPCDNLHVEIENPAEDPAALFEEIYVQGRRDIPLFVFNYCDYKIWMRYLEDIKGNKAKKDSKIRKVFFDALGCSDFDLDAFNYFYFSRTRKSLEHFYPQAKAVDDDEETASALTTTQINCFGNFAMIGAEANSSGSNWDPQQKLDHYLDSKSDPISVASLKFRIMMQRCQDNVKASLSGDLLRSSSMAWNFEDIQEHQKKMLEVMCTLL